MSDIDWKPKNREAIFLKNTDTELTFGEFWSEVNEISSAYKNKFDKDIYRIAINSERSIETIINIFALLHAGFDVVIIPETFTEGQIDLQKENVKWQAMIDDYSIGSFKDTPELNYNLSGSTILFSSGSTTTAKAIKLNCSNHYYSALGSNENIVFKEGNRWLLSLPIYHVGGLGILFRGMLGGGCVYIHDKAQALDEAILVNKITHLSVVETQLIRLLESAQIESFSNQLNFVLAGGGSISKRTLEQAHKHGFPIYRTYGLTEMGSQVSTFSTSNFVIASSGKLLPYRELKISDENEILVKGKTLFDGYIENGQLKPAVDDEGWFHTSDLGRLDSNNNLEVFGRKDRMFISGGENIYPEEIEAALLLLPNVSRAIVVNINDENFGQRPVAFIKVTDIKIDSDKIKKELKLSLQSFKIPNYFFKLPEDLIDNSLKISYENLRDYAQQKIRENN